VAKFLETRGEGIHHVAFEVEDLESALARAKEAGFTLIDEKPRPGAQGAMVAFLHPKSTSGVLIELCEHRRG
jgi:methylmalonyl-CoA/ethylmalonyl-CoA epimerase